MDEAISTKSIVSIYPYPVDEALFIQGLNQIQDAVIVLYDIAGRIVFEETKIKRNKVYKLSMSSFPAGIYVVKVQSGEIKTIYKMVKK